LEVTAHDGDARGELLGTDGATSTWRPTGSRFDRRWRGRRRTTGARCSVHRARVRWRGRLSTV